MTKYIIEIEEIKSCYYCPFWRRRSSLTMHGCLFKEHINNHWPPFNYSTEVHEHCPLKKMKD